MKEEDNVIVIDKRVQNYTCTLLKQAQYSLFFPCKIVS